MPNDIYIVCMVGPFNYFILHLFLEASIGSYDSPHCRLRFKVNPRTPVTHHIDASETVKHDEPNDWIQESNVSLTANQLCEPRCRQSCLVSK